MRLSTNVGFVDSTSKLARLAIIVGIVLRLRYYAFNRSLWLDESLLALNLIHRSYRQLLKPLDYSQGSRLGFLLVATGS